MTKGITREEAKITREEAKITREEAKITREEAKLMVGPGWSKILDQLYDKLPKSIYVIQVKEKFGSLRFYIGSGSNRTFDLIEKAERESEITCEICGKEGKIKNIEGWYCCRCSEHSEGEICL